MIYEKRISILERMYDGLKNDSAKLVKAIVQDLGRDATETYVAEIGSVMKEITRSKRALRRWMRGDRYGVFPSARCVPEPYGNVLILSPWNYPVSTCLSPLVSALAAGNKVTIKPSEITTTVEAALSEWVKEHVPEVDVVTGDANVAKELLERSWDFVFFTGSTRVGKLVAQRCAKDLIPYALELGGKSPVVVDKGVDLDLVASRVLWGKGMNAGQICIAPDYVLVHHSQRDALAKKMSGAPFKGKIVSDSHEKRLIDLGWTGGITVLDTNVHEEIFGPILPVIAYKDKKELEDLLLRYPDPLAMYVFSDRARFVDDVTSWVRSGGVVVNDVMLHIMSGAPFGGVGTSGQGRYHGKAGFDCFSYTRTYVRQKLNPSFLDTYRDRYDLLKKMF